MPTTWVIGASGLLGQHVMRQAGRAGHRTLRIDIPWDRPASVGDVMARGVEALASAADGRWNIVWAAGAGTVGATEELLRTESDAFSRLLEACEATGELDAQHGVLFVSSSAGGAYAGSTGPPFTERTTAVPLVPYGFHKLAMEHAAARHAEAYGLRTLIGRISNLYGPGQDLDKAQGLISQIARSHLVRRPVSIYVSLDTTRDYLFVADCAQMIVDALDGADGRDWPDTSWLMKILAAGRPVTIATLLGEFRRLTKNRLPVALAAQAASASQVRDLRMRSTVWTSLDRLASTPLPVGISATLDDLGRRHRAGGLRG